MEYVFLTLAVLVAIGVWSVWSVFKDCYSQFKDDCTGDCDQGRNCHCKDGD